MRNKIINRFVNTLLQGLNMGTMFAISIIFHVTLMINHIEYTKLYIAFDFSLFFIGLIVFIVNGIRRVELPKFDGYLTRLDNEGNVTIYNEDINEAILRLHSYENYIKFLNENK